MSLRQSVIPKLTTAQRNAIPTPQTNYIIFNTSTNIMEYYTGASWVPVSATGIVTGTANTLAYFNGSGSLQSTLATQSYVAPVNSTYILMTTSITGIGSISNSVVVGTGVTFSGSASRWLLATSGGGTFDGCQACLILNDSNAFTYTNCTRSIISGVGSTISGLNESAYLGGQGASYSPGAGSIQRSLMIGSFQNVTGYGIVTSHLLGDNHTVSTSSTTNSSVSFIGGNHTASGTGYVTGCIAIGSSNTYTATGVGVFLNSSVIIGTSNTLSSSGNASNFFMIGRGSSFTAIGASTNVLAAGMFVTATNPVSTSAFYGYNIDVTANISESITCGFELEIGSSQQMCVGHWNSNSANNSFEIGSGLNAGDRSNSLRVTKNNRQVETRIFGHEPLSPGALGAGFTISPDRSYLRISSAAPVTSDGTTAISNGSNIGQLLILENSGANNITIQNAANTQLNASSSAVLTPNSTLSLIWNGTDWLETSRSIV